jgi:hypothetical protein
MNSMDILLKIRNVRGGGNQCLSTVTRSERAPLQLEESCDQGKENNQTRKLIGILINGIVENTSVRIFGKN